MANLKMTVEDALKIIDERAARDVEHLIGEARCLKSEFSAALEACAQIPESVADLVGSATVALGQGVQVGWDGATNTDQISVKVHGHQTGEVRLSAYDVKVPAGKYRALFFLIPVKE